MNDSHDYPRICAGLSTERMQPFRAPGGDAKDALNRYQHNIELSEALYPGLHLLEVTLRNRLEAVLTGMFGENWFLEPRLENILLPDTERQKLFEARASLESANEDRRNKGLPERAMTSGRVVAELGFAFWTSLLGVPYEQVIWRSHQKMIFPETLSSQRNIKTIRPMLRAIRHLRNRVMHHEPIWNAPDLNEKYSDILELLRWLDPSVAGWLTGFDRFPNILTKNVQPKGFRALESDEGKPS
jgi:Abi-like protein